MLLSGTYNLGASIIPQDASMRCCLRYKCGIKMGLLTAEQPHLKACRCLSARQLSIRCPGTGRAADSRGWFYPARPATRSACPALPAGACDAEGREIRAVHQVVSRAAADTEQDRKLECAVCTLIHFRKPPLCRRTSRIEILCRHP